MCMMRADVIHLDVAFSTSAVPELPALELGGVGHKAGAVSRWCHPGELKERFLDTESGKVSRPCSGAY